MGEQTEHEDQRNQFLGAVFGTWPEAECTGGVQAKDAVHPFPVEAMDRAVQPLLLQAAGLCE